MNVLNDMMLSELTENEILTYNGGVPPKGGDKSNVGNCLGCGIAVAQHWIEQKWDSFMSSFMNSPDEMTS